MASHAHSPPFRTLALLAFPFATWAGITFLAGAERFSAAAAEGRYLALLAGAVVAALAALNRRGGVEAAAAALLVTATVWSIPYVPTRGAVVVAILVAALVHAAWRELSGIWSPSAASLWGVVAPLAVGTQCLWRSELLLSPELETATLAPLLLWPLLGAAATIALAGTRPWPALCSAGLVVALRDGWDPVSVAAVALPAIGILWRHTRDTRGRLLLTLAGLGVLLLAAFQSQRLALLLAAVAIALGAAESRRGRLLMAAVMAAVAAVLFFIGPVAGQGNALARSSWLLLLVPALFAADRRHRGSVLMLLLALPFALRYVPFEMALSGLLVCALVLLPDEPDAWAVQGAWVAALAALSMLLAAYPWLREESLRAALGLFGLEPGWLASMIVLGLGSLLILLLRWGRGMWRNEAGTQQRSLAVPAVAVLLFVAIAIQAWPPPRHTTSLGRTSLGQERPRWTTQLDGVPVSEIVIHSYAVHAAALDAGVPLAWVSLRGAGGAHHGWPLRLGMETDEWAAARAGLAALRGYAGPPAWLAWVTPDERFFGRRFRTRLELPQPMVPQRLLIRRNPTLPRKTELVLLQVELRGR